MTDWPDALDIVVEVPLGGFVKRDLHGTVDYISPFPSPFNYGCAPERMGGDGLPLDIVWLGPRRTRGHRAHVPVVGVVHFVDDGATDEKFLVCEQPPTPWQLRRVRAFFTAYARWKTVLNRLRGRTGATRYDGLTLR